MCTFFIFLCTCIFILGGGGFLSISWYTQMVWVTFLTSWIYQWGAIFIKLLIWPVITSMSGKFIRWNSSFLFLIMKYDIFSRYNYNPGVCTYLRGHQLYTWTGHNFGIKYMIGSEFTKEIWFQKYWIYELGVFWKSQRNVCTQKCRVWPNS